MGQWDSGSVDSLIEEGVIASALCPINTPLFTLVYLLPLVPHKEGDSSQALMGSEVGQSLGSALIYWGSPDSCLVMAFTVGQETALTFVGFSPSKGSESK